MSDTVKLIIEIPKDYYEALAKTEMIMTSPRSGKTFMSTIYSAVAHGTPLDDVKAEIENCSFDHYFEYGEYIGENPIQHRICMTDKVLEILSKAESEDT